MNDNGEREIGCNALIAIAGICFTILMVVKVIFH